MKVAILSESSADEAALRILIDAVLCKRTVSHSAPPLRSRGWPAVREILPSVLKHLHYRTDADGLVVVVDADDSTVHTLAHANEPQGQCRYCQLADLASKTLVTLHETPERRRVNIAIGVAVPALEAWLLYGTSPHIVEAPWLRGAASGPPPYTRAGLKMELYGSIRYSLSVERERMCEAAQRVAGHLADLERGFPSFGFLATALKLW